MVKIFKKLGNIIIGWWRYFTDFDEEFAKQRLEICNNCPHKIKILGDDYCSLCYCRTAAKVRIEDEICYDGRWNDIKINANEHK